MRRTLTGAFAVALAVLLINGVASFWNIKTLVSNELWKTHTHEVLSQLRQVQALLSEAETGQRGYLLTGLVEYLQPYETAVAQFPEAHQQLSKLTADNPVQVGRVKQLQKRANDRFEMLRRALELRREKGAQEALAFVRLGGGKAIMDEIRQILTDMEVHEQRLLSDRAYQSQRSATVAYWSLGMMTALAMALLAAAAVFVHREALERTRSAAIAEEYRMTFDLAGVGQVHTDVRDGRFLRTNAMFSQITGYSPEELLQLTTDTIVHPDDRESERALFKSLVDARIADYSNESRCIRKDGTTVWLSVNRTAVRTSDSRALRTIAVVQDINERKNAENVLRESESNFRQLADTMPQIVWTAKPDGVVDYLNRRWYTYTGLADDGNLNGPGWDSILHPDDHPRMIEAWHEAVRSEQPFEIEYRFKDNQSGRFRWHLGRALPVCDENGQVMRWFGTCTDIDDHKRAEDGLRQAREDLEERVRQRTAELAFANEGLRREVHERRRAQQEMSQSEERYRSLVDATTAIVWYTPESGEFVVPQPGWSAFTGQPFEELKGWGWLNAVHPDDRPHTADVWSAAVAGRTLYKVEHRLRRHNGEYRHMMVRAVPILDENGRIREWIGVHTDIDRLKRAEAAMRDAKEAAEAASLAKGAFLANMSHEIRTPMNGIIGMTDLALDTDLTAVQRDYLRTVKSSADSLLAVLNDILDFSKIEAGKLDLDPQVFQLRDSLADMLKPLAVRAHAKGLELAYHVAPDVPDRLTGDAGRIRQVVANLVSNALKFTEAGEVVVRVSARPFAEGVAEIQFEVSDTGVGIPDARLAAIFEPFVQADGSTTRKYGGTGLGLSISSRLVELMGGSLRVESALGRGSTFRFTVPLACEPPRESLAPADRANDLRVLIACANTTSRRILVELLQQWRMHPAEAGDIPAVRGELERSTRAGEPYSVLLLDSGLEAGDPRLLTELCERPEFAKTGVVLLTSTSQTDGTSRWREAAVSATLAKPPRQSDLYEALLAGATRQTRASTAPCEPVPVEPPVRTSLGLGLRVLLAEDNAVNQLVATRLLEKQGHTVTVVGDGRAALSAIESQSFDVVLMDVQMPEIDGLEAVAEVRRREAGTSRHLPVIALTAHAMKGDGDRCLEAGMDAYLTKPVRPEELRRALETIRPANGQDGTH